MDVTPIDSTLPVLPTGSMALTMLLQILETVTGPIPGSIAGTLSGNPWQGSALGGHGSAELAAVAMFPLLVAEAVAIAAVMAVRSRRRQRQHPQHRPAPSPRVVRVGDLHCQDAPR